MAARPVPPLSVHQPVLAFEGRGRLAARKVRGSDKFMAVVAEEFAATLIASWPEPFPPPLGTVTLKAEHVTPGRVVPHVTATLPVNPLAGVTVIVELTLPPAVTATDVPLIMKGLTTVKFVVAVLDDA
jgi:hypothetical protein